MKTFSIINKIFNVIDFALRNVSGKEDCYFQYVAAGATFYASMQVNQSNPSIHLLRFEFLFTCPDRDLREEKVFNISSDFR